jgi:hypothetical protein
MHFKSKRNPKICEAPKKSLSNLFYEILTYDYTYSGFPKGTIFFEEKPERKNYKQVVATYDLYYFHSKLSETIKGLQQVSEKHLLKDTTYLAVKVTNDETSYTHYYVKPSQSVTIKLTANRAENICR